MNTNLKSLIILLSAFIVALSELSCNRNYDYMDKGDDDFITELRKTLYLNTDSVINFINLYNTDDSILYYKLNNLLSRAYFIKGDTERAFETNERSIDFCINNKLKTDNILAEAYNNKGVYLNQTGDKRKAIEYLTMAYDLLNKDKEYNKKQITDISINIADCYHMSGNYNMASYWYRKALFFTDSMQLKGFEMPLYSGLAKLYLDLENFSLSNQYFNLAEQHIDSCSNYEKFFFYNSRGNYYFFTKEYDDALQWFYKAYNVIDENICRMTSSCNIGEIYLYIDQMDSAEIYLDQSLKIANNMQDSSSIFYINGIMAQLHIQNNDIEKAEKLINNTRNSYKTNPEYIYLQNKRLQMLYAAKGEYKKAYFYNKQMQEYNDSLRNMKIINMVSENDLRYKNDTTIINKNKKIEMSNKKISDMRFILTVSILLIIILVITFAFVITIKKRKEEERQRQMLLTLNQYKIESLKGRISPHYIFNVINALMPGIKNHKELQYPVRCMVRLLRNGISAGNNIFVELSKEIEYVNDYVTLYRLYNTNIPQIKWNISPQIDTDSCMIPTMIIQMSVENAVKYAFVNIENPELSIDIENNNGTEITIKDNGIGFNNTANKNSQHNEYKGTGSGLNTIRDMLNIINRHKNNKITFEISYLNENMGTKIHIFIPEDFNYDII